MSLSDIPATVQFGRRWPLGVLVSILVAGLWFGFETRANDMEIRRRLDQIEASDKARLLDERQQREAAARIGERMARLETRIDLATDLLKEIRDGLRRQPSAN